MPFTSCDFARFNWHSLAQLLAWRFFLWFSLKWRQRSLVQKYFSSIASLTRTLALHLLFCSVRRSLYGERKQKHAHTHTHTHTHIDYSSQGSQPNPNLQVSVLSSNTKNQKNKYKSFIDRQLNKKLYFNKKLILIVSIREKTIKKLEILVLLIYW